MLTIIIFVLVLSLLVFVHEFGHFITAKKSGIRVDEFGFGFPPRAFGIKKGGTIYSINWIPLGGFVKIKGESGEDAKDSDSFAAKSGWHRLMVLTAGVVMNVLLAWFLFTLGYVIGMPQIVENVSKYGRVTQGKTQVMSVLAKSPADLAGIKGGDEFLTVNGLPVDGAESVRDYTSTHEGQPMEVTYRRGEETLAATLTPTPVDVGGGEMRPAIGVELVKVGILSYPIWFAPVQGAVATWYSLREIVSQFGILLRDLVTQRPVTADFSGPVGIAIITSEVAAMGFRYLLQFTALLSLNLAVINILPIPALDGGRVLFLAIEKLRGRAASRRVEIMAHNIGFMALMLLVIVVTVGDIGRYGPRIWSGIVGMFGGS